MRRRSWILGLAVLTALFFVNGASAIGGNLTVNATDYANVTVSIAQQTWIDVFPFSLEWGATTALNPGSVGDNNSETNNYFAIQVENVGSHNITKVWFNASYPSSNPFGTGTPGNAGNYITLSKDENNDTMFFVNRVEYNATDVIVYLKDPSGNMPPDNTQYTYGRFRNASTEYFWMIDAVTNCNNTGTTVYIGREPHTRTQTGSTNFNDTSNYNTTTLTHISDGSTSYGYGNIDSGPLAGYCIAVSSDCRQVFFSKWNKDYPFQECSNAEYSWDDSVDGELAPGASFAKKIKVFVPYGVVQGDAQKGVLTVSATGA